MELLIDDVTFGKRRDSSLGDLTVRGNADGSALTVDGASWWPTIFMYPTFDGQTTYASMEAFPAGALVEVSIYIETTQTLSDGELASIYSSQVPPAFDRVAFNFYTGAQQFDSPAYCSAVITLDAPGHIWVDSSQATPGFITIVRMRRLA